MIDRYSLPEMASIWTEEAKLGRWHRVEVLALEAWESLGVVPPGSAHALERVPTPSPEAVAAREALTDHDLAAFVDLLADAAPTAAAWIHYGLTSSDVVDTALGVALAKAADLLATRTAALFETVKRRALDHRYTVMLGRTHGIWAEPTSFGLKLATWAFELARDHERLLRARRAVAVGKVSGAVGTYAHVPPQVEDYICRHLALSVEPASSQVTHRDRHAELVTTLAVVGGSIERFATEIRHLQRSEVGEVLEPFREGQKGSSSMPHKRNPIVSERMAGLARLLRGYAATALENVALWHERDISHSSAERVIFADACTVLHYMLVTFERVVAGLTVNEKRMRNNLEATGGLVYSQAALLALARAGMPRDSAYAIVQRHAMTVWESGGELEELLAADPEVILDRTELARCFQPERFLENAGVVFDRLEGLTLA